MFAAMEQDRQQATGLFSLLGHKGDLMLVHFRKALDDINLAELTVAGTAIGEYLEPTSSYLSVVELGLYEATVKAYTDWMSKGLRPGTAEWNREVDAELAKHREAATSRLWPEIPQRRYLCFYPMNKFRGETKNWYGESIRERQRMMHEHGNIWSKVSCPERLSVTGPAALNGERNAYRDVVPFAKRLVETFPDRVLWGTDWPHPNLRSHMPDDGELVDLIPRLAPSGELQRRLLVDNPQRLYWNR